MSRRRAFQTGAVFTRVSGALPAAVRLYTQSVGQQEIPIRSLVATQKRLDPTQVKKYRDEPGSPIDVVRGSDGRPYIFDGHHRAAAAKARGAKTITAQVST